MGDKWGEKERFSAARLTYLVAPDDGITYVRAFDEALSTTRE